MRGRKDRLNGSTISRNSWRKRRRNSCASLKCGLLKVHEDASRQTSICPTFLAAHFLFARAGGRELRRNAWTIIGARRKHQSFLSRRLPRGRTTGRKTSARV